MKCLKLCLRLDSSLLQFSLMVGSFIVDVNYGLLNFTVFSDMTGKHHIVNSVLFLCRCQLQ